MSNQGLVKFLDRRYKKLQKIAKKSGVEKAALEILRNLKIRDRNLQQDLERAIDFGIKKFRGICRQDRKTPLFLHSLFLLEILMAFNEISPETALTAVLHDALEDTSASEKEIHSLKFKSTKAPIAKFVKNLTQSKKISDKLPRDNVISPRVREFIKRLVGAPKEVIGVELADRVHDLLDLDYMKTLLPQAAKVRLKNKIARDKIIVSAITKNRKDINMKLLGFFKFLANSRTP